MQTASADQRSSETVSLPSSEARHMVYFARRLNEWLNFEEGIISRAVVHQLPVKAAAMRVRNAIAQALGDVLLPEVVRMSLDELDDWIADEREKLKCGGPGAMAAHGGTNAEVSGSNPEARSVSEFLEAGS